MELHIAVFQEEGWYVAQCLEYDIVAQAKTLEAVKVEWDRMFEARLLIGKELGIEPLEGIPPAPAKYHGGNYAIYTRTYSCD